MLLWLELKGLEKNAMCVMVVETGERVDGRRPTRFVQSWSSPDTLFTRPWSFPAWSDLFSLYLYPFGMLNEWQRLDTIEPMDGALHSTLQLPTILHR